MVRVAMRSLCQLGNGSPFPEPDRKVLAAPVAARSEESWRSSERGAAPIDAYELHCAGDS